MQMPHEVRHDECKIHQLLACFQLESIQTITDFLVSESPFNVNAWVMLIHYLRDGGIPANDQVFPLLFNGKNECRVRAHTSTFPHVELGPSKPCSEYKSLALKLQSVSMQNGASYQFVGVHWDPS